nr:MULTISPECIES: ribosome maturation factor RimM [Myxococcaceae]
MGYVARAHGLQGEVAVRTFDPASDALDYVPRVLVRPRVGPERVLAIESVRGASKETLVSFEAVQGRSDAEALVGASVLAFREDLEAPEEGEYFQGDLVGLRAVDEQGAELGQVEEIWETGEVPNLVIRKAGDAASELVLPFADDFVVSVDLEQGRLVVRPPEFIEDKG